MKTLLPLATGVVLLSLASAAGAYTGHDGIGIFFDQNGTQSCQEEVPGNTLITAYLCAMNISEESGLSGWEAHVVLDGTFAYSNFDLISGLNVFTPPEFQVGLATKFDYAPVIVLLNITVFYLGGPVRFGLGPTTPTSFPRSQFPEGPGPGYAAGDDPGILRRLTEVTNVPIAGQPGFFYVAFVNDSEHCPVTSAERNSWGAVKALYR
jgi:hypothetical protein